jgi:hypothetical protein
VGDEGLKAKAKEIGDEGLKAKAKEMGDEYLKGRSEKYTPSGMATTRTVTAVMSARCRRVQPDVGQAVAISHDEP